jgi:hypothetical protein
MDGIKLYKWKQRFTEEAALIETEFDAFFKQQPLNAYYQLSGDKSDGLSLVFCNDLPHEIKDRLQKTLLNTKPEDNIWFTKTNT